MNVLFLEQHPRFGGGSERVSLSLCTYLYRHGHSTHLLHEAEGDMVSAYAEVTRSITRARVLPAAVREPLEASVSLFLLRRAVRDQSIDVIFTSQVSYTSLLALAERLMGLPSVVHLGLALDFKSQAFTWSQRQIAATVTPSEPMRRQCQAIGWPADRLHVVPNGVDLARFRPSTNVPGARDRIGIDGDAPLVVFAGRLVAEKGIFTLLRAAACLAARGVRLHLAMAGWAPLDERERLAALAAELGLERFSLLAPTDRVELLFCAAEIVVVPSEWDEPFGLVAIEAMACGAVPVVSDAGILPEILGPEAASCVFPRGDVGRLADTLEGLLASAEVRSRIREACMERVRATFSLERFGEAYAGILEGAIDSV